MNLQEFCKMLNEKKVVDFIFHKIKITKAWKTVANPLDAEAQKRGTKIVGYLKVIEGDTTTHYEFDANEFKIGGIIDGA